MRIVRVVFLTWALALSLLWVLESGAVTDRGRGSCTYRTYKWNVDLRRAVEHETVRHPYDELAPEEIDASSGCTVCEEDQVEVEVTPLRPFRMCSSLAPEVRAVLTDLLAAGEPINEVVGYRVGRSRGDVDLHGNRTEFSNHSYGIALDINPLQNGLYDHCDNFGPLCRLIRGGPWRPGEPGTLTADGRIVIEMRKAGFEWGGEIAGRQKDFMHFSPSGY